MVDYQFLGLVAVVFAVLTRGSILPVLTMTAIVAAVLVGYEAVIRRYQRRQMDPSGLEAADAHPTDHDLTRWISVIDRVLKAKD